MMNFAERIAAQDALAEFWLLSYPAKKHLCDLAREEVLHAAPKPADEGKTTHISRVTENKALRLSSTWCDKAWCDTIECCLSEWKANRPQWYRLVHIRWELGRQKRSKRQVGKPGWVDASIELYAEQTGSEPYRNTVSGWWRAMVLQVARYAAERGCFRSD